MPVRREGSATVVSKASRQAAWTQGAANVGIEAGLKPENSQRANPDPMRRRGLEDQYIGTRLYRETRE